MRTLHRCSVQDCQRNGSSIVNGDRRVCLMHYKRWKRSGDLGGAQPSKSRNPHKRACAVVGCDAIQDGNAAHCKMHDTRVRRHGDPTKVIAPEERAVRKGERSPHWSGDAASYSAAHQRIRAHRGSARAHPCVDRCGRQAAHWSYDRSDPDEKRSELGPYSTDLSRYVPRCVRCHKAFDLAAIRALTDEVSV
ncbi:hypothetical protein [Microbacterium sp. Ld14]|uniref:hypothetical protein n=1 Tax=Microbacterium sp. Ld14 TaxID=649156 RepID=UPI0038633FFF